MSLNKVLLIGNVGKDPEVRHLESGVAVVTLLVVTSERIKDRSGEWRELTEWHNVVLWRNLAELVEKSVRKGSQIFIEGKLRNKTWEDQNGVKRYATEVVADDLRLLWRRGDNNNIISQQSQHAGKFGVSDIANEQDVDDLPF